MTAYDLFFPQQINLYIANFNIMAHTASKFAIPKDAYIHSSNGEEPEQWLERYSKILEILRTSRLDIICLEEVVQEFYNLLLRDVYFRDTYYLRFDPANKLLMLIKKTICVYLSLVQLPTFKYSKLQAYEIFLPNNKYIIVVNAHLIGDPAQGEERRHVLRELTTLYPSNLIIIGDLNEDLQQSDIMWMGNFTILEKDHKTAYSRYHINPAGFVTGIKQEQWENIDNIIYDNKMLTVLDHKVFPEGGLHGRHAPYIPLQDSYTYEKNFDFWPSDHTLNIYNIGFIE